MIDLYRINLNLLVALDVLLNEKSVTLAANKLCMTQAAMSNNLQQLRKIFKDDLLLREKNYMVLTSYALTLQASLHPLLEEVRSLILAGQRFNPQVSQRIFKVGMSDYIASLLLPNLLRTLEEKAPSIKIKILSVDRRGAAETFEKEECDLLIGKVSQSNAIVKKQLLFKDRGVCVLNRAHPLAHKQNLSLDDYLAYQHIGMRVDNPDTPRLIEDALSQLGVERDLKIATPFMGAVFQLLQKSKLLLGTVAEKVALLYQKHYDFVIKPLPFAIQEIEFYLLWHQRYDNDFGHKWLREECLKIFNSAG